MTSPLPPGRPDQIDSAEARWLAWHEARCHGLVGRQVSLLGDAVMLHDPEDREPFWNRIAGIAWPTEPAAFDRRLAEAITLFGALDRIPHFWPLPGYDEPPDLVARLVAHGFEDMGAGVLMVLDPSARPGTAPVDDGLRRGLTVERFHLVSGSAADEAAAAIASVLAKAFAIEPGRESAIAEETILLLERDEFHVCLVSLDGVPAAAARRTTFAGASYLSSIGTSARFRGRGLGRLVTEEVLRDAVDTGSRWTYLGVFAENDVARRMYESLGFVAIGGSAPDLLLRG